MRPTPETDANRGYALTSHYGRSEGSYLQIDRSGPFVHAEVARKLERERDEAREALRTLAEHGESEIQRVTKERDEAREDLQFRRGLYKVQEERLEKAERERDEAMAKYAAEATEHMLAINKLAGERDEARADAKHWEELYRTVSTY